MNRRAFLTGAAVLGAGRLATAASNPGVVPAIDTHTHFYDPTRPQGVPWPPRDDALLHRPHLPADFARATVGRPIAGTVVVEASEWVEDNQWILDLAAKHEAIVGFVGNLRPGLPPFAADLKRFAAQPLFRGLRFRAADVRQSAEPAILADVRRLADAGLSLDVVGGPAILPGALHLARTFPSLRIVLDHVPFREWDQRPDLLRATLDPLARCGNVFAKISDVVRRVKGEVVEDAAHYRPLLDALVDLFGPERILYGSNWAVSERVAPYATVHRVVGDYFAARGRDLAERFFWRNSRAAYRWVPRGAAAKLGP